MGNAQQSICFLKKEVFNLLALPALVIGTAKVGGERKNIHHSSSPHAITTALHQSEFVLTQNELPRAYLTLLLPPTDVISPNSGQPRL